MRGKNLNKTGEKMLLGKVVNINRKMKVINEVIKLKSILF